MAAPGELSVQVAHPDPPVEPAPPDALAILRDAETCAPLTDEDVRHAFERGGEFDASVYIGATVITRCTQNGSDFEAFRADHSLANRIIAAGKPQTGTTAQGRRAAVARLREERKGHAAGATRFAAILAAVRGHQDGFTQEYAAGGKVSMARMGELYDATDTPPHPAIRAVEQRLAATREERVRAAIIGADRLLRHMILQARATESAEPAAA